MASTLALSQYPEGVQDGQLDLRIRERSGTWRRRFDCSLLRATGDYLANGRLLRDPLHLGTEDLAVGWL